MFAPGFRRGFEKALLQGTEASLSVPPEIAERWTRNFWRNSLPDLSCLTPKGRRLNNFKVGSDPEFCFHERNNNTKFNAIDLNMKPALAFGADQNSRLVELRPYPSTSVVEHVAGIMSVLRWMVRQYPYCLDLNWRCGAFFDGDGMGGHVHFGRKRDTRPNEVEGLDGLARTMRVAGFFPEKEWLTRAMGDARHQIYGAYGDIRLQAHGYEYRTLPSWLGSPTLAFVVIAASKLVVLDPDISKGWAPVSRGHAIRLLTGLAKYFAGLDDDAMLLYHLLQTNPPYHVGGCFKTPWGLSTVASASLKGKALAVIPADIEPQVAEVQEMQAHLVTGIPLDFKELPVNFISTLPKGYVWPYAKMPLQIRPGFGDFFHDLVIPSNEVVTITYSDMTELSANWFTYHPPERQAEVTEMLIDFGLRVNTGHKNMIAVGRNLLADACKMREFKKYLLNSQLFPVWTVKSVQSDSYEKWKSNYPVAVKKSVLKTGVQL